MNGVHDYGCNCEECKMIDELDYQSYCDNKDRELIDTPLGLEDDHPVYDEDDSMDGDHESALASAGWGTDEDYGCYDDDAGDYGDW